MKIIKKDFHFHTYTITATIFQKEEPTNKAAFIFPGRGYTAQAPLLFYSRNLCINKNYDCIQINYHDALSVMNEEEFVRSVQEIVKSILDERNYNDLLIISKSIGSIAHAQILKANLSHSLRSIWLTPLIKMENVFTSLKESSSPSIALIGDEDPHYSVDKWTELGKHNKTLVQKVYFGCDHSIEKPKFPIESIDILKQVILDIDSFIR